MSRISTFLKEVRAEMAKVSWPTQRQLVVYTFVVIGISLFLTIYLGALDFLFQEVLNRFILR